MVTPLLASLKEKGGTLYTFTSAANDLTKVFTNESCDFKFSHFACLNLPDIKSGKFDSSSSEAGLYLETLYNETLENEDSSKNWNKLLAENIQNYVMNFEVALRNGCGDNDNYNDTLIKTVSERVFFNWLEKVGAIKFEKIDSKIKDNGVVKYIGTIDIVNSVDVAGDSYDEVYIHIPSSVGASSPIFEEINDENYEGGESYSCGSSNKIIGRDELEESPYGLSLTPLYDGNNSYKTSGYGKCINFNDTSYDGGIMTMNEKSTEDFEFNCVLLYYTLTVGGKSVTNLYGVLFLEEVTSMGEDSAYIQRYPKIAGGTGFNGNSYALKVDLKIDTLPDVSMTKNTYNDVNDDYAGALSIYTKSLLQIQSLVNKVLSDQNEINSLKERIDYLENQLSLINEIPTLKNKVNEINDTIAYSDVVVNGESLLDLIELNSNRLDAIINGKSSAKLTIDSSAINSGDGISTSADDNGKLTISSNAGLYSVSNFYTSSELNDDDAITSENSLMLNSESTSEMSVYTSMPYGTIQNGYSVLYFNSDKECNVDLKININDYSWKTGQYMRIRFQGNNEFSGAKTYGKSTGRPKIKIFCGSTELTQSKVIYANEVNGLESIDVICVNSNASEAKDRFLYEIKTR